MATWQRKLGSTADRETKYDLGHDAAHQLVSATLKQTSDSAVVKDGRWGYDSIGNRTSEHDITTGVTADYSHNNTNQHVTKKTYSSGQKPWVKGSLDEAGCAEGRALGPPSAGRRRLSVICQSLDIRRRWVGSLTAVGGPTALPCKHPAGTLS
ncbi:MAG: hypothetical protein NTV80_16645 [Verrucomicrobia bacterium]|nr:hypothetical protein [Verrucomicrobiota bacterium]